MEMVKLRYISDKPSARFKKGAIYEGYRLKDDPKGCMWCFYIENDDDPGTYAYSAHLFEVVPDEEFNGEIQKL